MSCRSSCCRSTATGATRSASHALLGDGSGRWRRGHVRKGARQQRW
jgi:hypothetical protein